MSSPECHKSGTLPLSPGSLGGDEHAANRFYLEDLAPDILLDQTPGALRGVEAAGRGTGGFAKLRELRLGTRESPGKALQLIGLPDVYRSIARTSIVASEVDATRQAGGLQEPTELVLVPA